MGTLEELIETRAGVKLAIGESATGTIKSTSSQQSTNFDTKQPDTWDDGKPKMLAVFVIDVDGSAEDAAVYVQWWGSQRFALEQGLNAFKGVSGRGPQPGDRMRVTYVRDETDADREARGAKGRKPPIPAKLYRYDFTAGVPVPPSAGTSYPDDTPF